MEWQVGITSVLNREESYFARTLKSITNSGFRKQAITIFLDGAKHEDAVNYETKFDCRCVVRHSPNIRVFGNWMLSLLELFLRKPKSDRFIIFQDDVVCSLSLREYLEKTPYPERGYLNLLTFASNEKIIINKPTGWHEASILNDQQHPLKWQTGRGAVGLCFSREGVMTLLSCSELYQKPLTPVKHNNWNGLDGAIVTAMNLKGWREYIHNPSLLQHIGDETSMSFPEYQIHPKHPKALSFRGENFDLLQLLGKG